MLHPIHKLAALLPDVQLQPHQQQLTDRFKDNPARVLTIANVGSGKSLSSIALAEQQKEPYTAVVPAALRNNFRKEYDRFTDQSTPLDIFSYTALAKGRPLENTGTLIFDEAHRLRNIRSKQTIQAQRAAEKAKQLVLLTGTPIVNHPSDITSMINMITGRNMSPEEFSGRYIGEKMHNPGLIARLRGVQPTAVPEARNLDELRHLLKGHIDYYPPAPSQIGITHEDVPVVMGPRQSQLYRAMWGELPWILRYKLQQDYPLSKEELSRALSFLNGPRQVSLSTYPYLRNKNPDTAFSHSTKLQRARELMLDKLQDPRTKALVFSNFIDAGLTPYSHALTKAKIPNAMFHGGLSDEQRKQLVDDYNNNKLRVALLGPSGAEGLSFKGTQLIQILDPHWNTARTHQAEGRGIRYDSHWGLPEDLQNVHIQRFVSKLPPSFQSKLMRWFGHRPEPGRASDDYLIELANHKNELNTQFLELLKQIGSEHRNRKDGAT